ncbi:hypothetical protein [Massilia sp. TWP1-3-3]|uniref:hypothetical protein n=1 Tax=Massilia sp. TWP1-3-3 TaxID=2804573 RepID=UPI003CF81E55
MDEILQGVPGKTKTSNQIPKGPSDQPSVEAILQSGPKQGVKAAKKATDISLTPTAQKDTHTEPVKFTNISGRYAIVTKITRPKIVHDGGFVERYGRRAPTKADAFSRAKWKAKLNGAEATCGPITGPLNPLCNFEDQTDATAAYRYFWEGKGKDRWAISYEKYLRSDPSALNLVGQLVNDFIGHIEVIGKNRTTFQVVSGQYAIGEEGFAPYPATVNWQRAIGAHILWVSATVTASVRKQKIEYAAEMTIHMEDRYNFNPGGTDIGSGTIKDEENGAFEMNGWANSYMNYAAVARGVMWTEGDGRARVIVVRPVPPPDKMAKSLWE